jgi:hypothetical protein
MVRRADAANRPTSRLERRVAAAAEATLTRSKSVSPLDVLAQIGWLPESLVDDWGRGRVDHLDRVVAVQPDKLATALGHLRRWAVREGLEPNEVAYRGLPLIATRVDPTTSRAASASRRLVNPSGRLAASGP